MRASHAWYLGQPSWPCALLLAALAAGACSESEPEAVQRAVEPADPTPARAAATSPTDAGSQPPTASAPPPSAANDQAADAQAADDEVGDDEADAFVPSECSALGYNYALGCEDCPTSTITCPCAPFDSYGMTSFQLGCSYGTCFVSVSCDVWCAAADAQPADAFLSSLSCPTVRTCSTQPDCGGGYCYGETASQRGSCVAGANGDDCFDPSDCQGGFCGPRGCSAGQPDARCATESDCAAGKCTRDIENDSLGFCSSGEYDEKCYSDDDCAPELYCHTGATRCFTGELGGACQTTEQCKSGACALGSCVTGQLGGDCENDENCESGHCVRPELSPGVGIAGSCVTGAAGEACYFDGDCESGHCLSVAHNVEGICTERAAGDPCFAAADCDSASCTERSQQPSSDCQQATDAAATCDNTGLCIDEATCSSRTCD